MPSRFEIDYRDTNIAWEPLVDEVFGELTSSFLEMPKGEGSLTIRPSKRAIRPSSDIRMLSPS